MSVEVRYLGHLGNNLFQYALGRILAEAHGLSLLCSPTQDIPGWNKVECASGVVDRLQFCDQVFVDAPQTLPGKVNNSPQCRYVMGEIPGWTGQALNFDYLLREGADKRIVLQGYFQQAAYFHPYQARIRSWFRFKDENTAYDLHDDDVIVHLRQSLDMFMLDRALDLSYYRDVLSGLRFRKVYVCGLGLDERVKAALAEFNPVYLDLPALETLKLMTRAKRIVMSNGTFSWWGAYLSQADTIFFPRPVSGFWGKERSDVNLEVAESRYVYLDDVPVQTWRPFKLDGKARYAHEHSAQTGDILIAENKGRAIKLAVPPELRNFSRWLAQTTDTHFGMHEIHAQDLSSSGRRSAIKVLLALRQHGFLAAEANALEGVANFHGVGLPATTAR